MDPTPEEQLKDWIQRHLIEGFLSDDEIVESVVERASDEFEMANAPGLAKRMTAELAAGHRIEQKAWPAVTDCDRLDRAFARLNAAGIVARQNFTCCQTCGHAEIGDEIESEGQRMKVRGYTFYHQQDTENAVDGGGVFLAYGGVGDDPEAAVRIGREISDAVKAEGLLVDWNGSVNTRIKVSLDWRRRR